MTNFVEQRICIKFCVRNEISCTKTVKMMRKCFGDKCMSRTRIFEWYKMFKEGRERVEDGNRSGRPSTSTDDKHVKAVKELVLSDKGLTIKDIAERVGISYGSCQAILRRANTSPSQEDQGVSSEDSLQIPDFMFQNLANSVPQAPDAPDMALFYFFLSSWLKLPPPGFDSKDATKNNTLGLLNSLPEIDHKKCFEDWKEHWHRCMTKNGDNSEGNKINSDE